MSSGVPFQKQIRSKNAQPCFGAASGRQSRVCGKEEVMVTVCGLSLALQPVFYLTQPRVLFELA